MKFIVDGVDYEYNEDHISFAEAKAVEKKGGMTLAEIGDTKYLPTQVMQAMIWVGMKRQRPTLLYDDLEEMDIGEVRFKSDAPDPADEGEEAAAGEAPDPTGAVAAILDLRADVMPNEDWTTSGSSTGT